MRAFQSQIIGFVILLFSLTIEARAQEDWGAYGLFPVNAPRLALEAVQAGTTEGTIVSIGTAVGKPNQKWFIIPKGDDYFAIRPSYSSSLVLTVRNGETQSGAAIVLETDKNQPWQQWKITQSDGGTFVLAPRHAPETALDHFGGVPEPGAKIDIWSVAPGDTHLQWQVRALAGTNIPAGNDHEQVTTYMPPVIKPEDVLKGEIKTSSFSSSSIFPGTVRDVTVFIPAQYDASKPACVYVKTDGYNATEKQLLETMIATGEMPVTVGIFVSPGEVPAPAPGTLGRRNRDFEYDALGDDNVRFLLEELLPIVSKKFDLKLSDRGNDRCIAGGSSGGIAAFNAAWERPDAFSRVYANSGSFVAFRGGNEFPTLIRKFEAKPIRAYLTTGTHDMENAGGDWFLADQEMDKALKFSGYDYFFRVVNGGHVAGYYDHWREAMSYLWKGWPQPVQAGPSSPRAQDILLPGEGWEQIGGERRDARGATCNAEGEVFFTEDNRIYRINPDGKISLFLDDAEHANSLSCGPQGQLYAISSETGKVMSYDAAAKGHVVVQGIWGNYVLALPQGGLYVTAQGDSTGDKGQVWFVKDGQKTLVDSGLKFATGLAYRPDQWLLSVADGHSKWAYSYQIALDGRLKHKERFFRLHVPDWEDDAGAESICYSKEGQMFVATRSGIQVCADDGPTQVILPLPDRSRVLSACLGGKNLDTLYAFSMRSIWRRKVKVHAVGAFTPWVSINQTPL